MKITIIGAGIGGLTTAIALEQKGFEVEIFEAFPAMEKVGAGIVLANNAMKVYQRLGLQSILEEAGHRIDQLNVVDESLVSLSGLNLKSFEASLGVHYVSIHRGDLQQLLLSQLKTTKLNLAKRLNSVSEKDDGVLLHFDDGTTHTSSVLLAADGIHSKVRQSIFPDAQIRSARQACWRGVTKMHLPEQYLHQLNESWGNGTRFGIVPLGGEEVYWFAVSNYQSDFKKEFDGFSVKEIFTGYHPLVSEIIASTPENKIMLNDLDDLEPLNQWHTRRICLIGDAAHATTPNMGQGACQAIEDALAISICLEKEDDPFLAFAKFQKLRMKKANSVIRRSWGVGKLAHLPKGIKRNLRNSLMRMTPEWVAAKQTASIFELNF